MKVSHIEHLGIAVKSLDEAIPYWENVLGLKCYAIEEVADQKVRTAFFMLGQTKIELLEITDSHFQVDVTTAAGTKHYYYNTTPAPSLGNTANPKAKKNSVTEATLTLDLDLSGATKVAVLYTPKHGATGEPNDSYNDIYGTWDITDAIKDSIPTA